MICKISEFIYRFLQSNSSPSNWVSCLSLPRVIKYTDLPVCPPPHEILSVHAQIVNACLPLRLLDPHRMTLEGSGICDALIGILWTTFAALK